MAEGANIDVTDWHGRSKRVAIKRAGGILPIASVLIVLTASGTAQSQQQRGGVDFRTAPRAQVEASAGKGNAEAEYELAFRFYDCTQKHSQNCGEAARLYRLAAVQGNANAQFRLGFILGAGVGGVKPDKNEAFKWDLAAARQGIEQAQLNVAYDYREGFGTTQNDAEALHWTKIPANNGNVESQFRLGELYLAGRGIPQDYSKAHMWFNVTSARGYQNTLGDPPSKMRDDLANKMNSDQLAKAQAMATHCVSLNYKNCDP